MVHGSWLLFLVRDVASIPCKHLRHACRQLDKDSRSASSLIFLCAGRREQWRTLAATPGKSPEHSPVVGLGVRPAKGRAGLLRGALSGGKSGRSPWRAWRYQTRVNPRIEITDQGPTSPRGSGETVRMGAAATISLPQASRLGPSWLAAVWSSGFGGRLNFLCAPGRQ